MNDRLSARRGAHLEAAPRTGGEPRAGCYDAVYALRHPEILERSSSPYETLATFDFRGDQGDWQR